MSVGDTKSEVEAQLKRCWRAPASVREKGFKLLKKILQNVIDAPQEPKFRKLKRSKVIPKLEDLPGSSAILEIAGWQYLGRTVLAEQQSHAILPESVGPDRSQEVLSIVDSFQPPERPKPTDTKPAAPIQEPASQSPQPETPPVTVDGADANANDGKVEPKVEPAAQELDELEEVDPEMRAIILAKRKEAEQAKKKQKTKDDGDEEPVPSKPVSAMTHEEKMQWLEEKRIASKKKREKEKREAEKARERSRREAGKAALNLQRQREEFQRQALISIKKKEEADKRKQRKELKAKLKAEKEARARQRAEDRKLIEKLRAEKAKQQSS